MHLEVVEGTFQEGEVKVVKSYECFLTGSRRDALKYKTWRCMSGLDCLKLCTLEGQGQSLQSAKE